MCTCYRFTLICDIDINITLHASDTVFLLFANKLFFKILINYV